MPEKTFPTIPIPEQVVNDPNQPIEARLVELEELLRHAPHDAARFVVREICDKRHSGDWRNAMVLAAERLQVSGTGLRRRLTRRLFELADDLRHNSDATTVPIVYSAIRNYASMIPTAEINALRTFLDPPSPVDTRLVALQCIVHQFENEPPRRGGAHKKLADRVHELATKFLDKDWLVAGEKAAIGQNAALALAAMGDARLTECVAAVRELRMNWLTRQVVRKLETLLEGWSERPRMKGRLAYQVVHEQLAVLRAEASGV